LGEDLFSQELRQGLISAAQSSDYFAVTGNRKESDAVFKRSVKRSNRPKSSILTLDLVDRSGKIIWSFSSRLRNQSSTAQEVSTEVLKALLRDLRASARKP